MSMIVDVNSNNRFTEANVALHCLVVSKDPNTCREQHLYGSEIPLGMDYEECTLLNYLQIDYDFEGEFGVQLPRIGENSSFNLISRDIQEGFNLATPPMAVIRLDKPTKNGKYYIPLNGRTRRAILENNFSFKNGIFDVYTLTTEHFQARYRVAGLKFNKPGNPAQAVTKNELLAGVREAIQNKEEGLVPKLDENGNPDSDDMHRKIRTWFDKVLGSPKAGGRYMATTREGWTCVVVGNWQDENQINPKVRSWLDPELRRKWRQTHGFVDTPGVLHYVDASYDLWTNSIRDSQKIVLQYAETHPNVEVRICVNCKLVDSQNLAETYVKRRDKFAAEFEKQIKFHLDTFGNGCERNMNSQVKLYATYPALEELHGEMDSWVLY